LNGIPSYHVNLEIDGMNCQPGAHVKVAAEMLALLIGLPALLLVYMVATQIGIGAAIGVAVGLVVLERFIRVVIPLVRTVLRNRKVSRLQQPPQAMARTKASEGAGILALSGFVVVLAQAEGYAVSSTPLLWAPLTVAIVWGALWLVTSGLQAWRYGSQGPVDTVVLVRALVKIGIGITLAWFLHPYQIAQLLWAFHHAPTVTAAALGLAFIAGWAIAWWCFCTGAVKTLLVLLTMVRRRRRKSPVASSAHGQADFAGAAEASRAMQGKGRRSKMEGVKF
jgi:hypothetical protein